MVEQYIKVYEWILRHPELSRLEALIICEVMRWPYGCYKSSRSLSGLFKADPRTVQKAIKSLRRRQWLAVLPDRKKNERILYATPKDPPEGPLFEYQQKAAQAIIKRTSKQLTLF